MAREEGRRTGIVLVVSIQTFPTERRGQTVDGQWVWSFKPKPFKEVQEEGRRTSKVSCCFNPNLSKWPERKDGGRATVLVSIQTFPTGPRGRTVDGQWVWSFQSKPFKEVQEEGRRAVNGSCCFNPNFSNRTDRKDGGRAKGQVIPIQTFPTERRGRAAGVVTQDVTQADSQVLVT